MILFHGVRKSIRIAIGNLFTTVSPAKGWPIEISFKRNDWVFHTGPWFWPHVSWHLSRYCVSCLSCATQQSGDDIHDFCCCHLWCWWSLFSEYCIRPRIVLYNITSEYNSTFVFLVFLPPIRHSWNDKCPSVKQNELLRPSSLLHRSPPSYFWISSSPTPESFPIFPFFVHCCLCCGCLHGLKHGNKFVNEIVMLQWVVLLSCNMVLMINW